MQELVITAVGRDRHGLVEALSGVVAAHGANWERSSMAELAGTFAGVVSVRVPTASVDALLVDLDRLEADGLLRLEVERGTGEQPVETAERRHRIEVTGQDHPGIVHEITHALAERQIGIETFTSEVVPAPLGGQMFTAALVVRTDPSLEQDALREHIEAVATDLIVDVEPAED